MRLENKEIIVTGGAGFIGSHLVDRLLADGNKVLVIDDMSSGTPDNIAHHAADPNLRLEEADIRDEQAMMKLVKGADVVFHLACRNVRLSLRRPTEVHQVNTSGTLSMLKAAAAANVERFLYVSSSEVNGTAEVVPMPEDYHFKPETIYGASKLAGEYYTMSFHRSGWVPALVARPHNNYGPREHYYGYKGEVIPRFILWCLAGMEPVIYGDGLQTRDFTYVTETVDCMVGLMECDEALGGTFNVCKGNEVSVRDLADMIIRITGADVTPRFLPGRPSDVLRLFGDSTRLKAVLGRSPLIEIREGLDKTVEWFQKNVPPTADVLNSMQPQNWESCEAEHWLELFSLSSKEGACES